MNEVGKMQSSERQRQWEPDIIDIRRNPYPTTYEDERNLPRAVGTGQLKPRRRAGLQEQPISKRRSDLQPQMIPQRRSNLQGQAAPRRRPELQQEQPNLQRRSDLQQPIPQRRPGQRRQANPAGNARSRQAALQRRRKYIRRQRISVGIFVGCIVAVFCFLVILPKETSAAGTSRENRITREQKTDQVQTPETFIQGLPATVFSSHPEWTEDFLTPNEFSRPGEALPEIKNIFVHYTANPGTSASQNRSYFEQQKDTRQVSVSAHFIIGYEGEILQCVPLDEIAYAVQSRNYDSVSIECCYKAEDGSFTQETYDSLISLLAWLTDAYDLEAEDILRHYDCGGKKCPLYYTEHPDAWERLKEDVAQASGA